MNKKIAVEFVSVHGIGWSGSADMVVARGISGELGIIPGHSSLITVLRPGNVRIVNDQKEVLYYVGGGILEVQPDQLTILASDVVEAEKLDPIEVEKRRVDAEKILKETQTSDIEFVRARVELTRALAQYNTINRNKHSK